MNNPELKIRAGNNRHTHSGGSMSKHTLAESRKAGTGAAVWCVCVCVLLSVSRKESAGSAMLMAGEKDQTHLSDSLTFIRRQLGLFAPEKLGEKIACKFSTPRNFFRKEAGCLDRLSVARKGHN